MNCSTKIINNPIKQNKNLYIRNIKFYIKDVHIGIFPAFPRATNKIAEKKTKLLNKSIK